MHDRRDRTVRPRRDGGSGSPVMPPAGHPGLLHPPPAVRADRAETGRRYFRPMWQRGAARSRATIRCPRTDGAWQERPRVHAEIMVQAAPAIPAAWQSGRAFVRSPHDLHDKVQPGRAVEHLPATVTAIGRRAPAPRPTAGTTRPSPLTFRRRRQGRPRSGACGRRPSGTADTVAACGGGRLGGLAIGERSRSSRTTPACRESSISRNGRTRRRDHERAV